MKTSFRAICINAFTLIELLVVLAIIAMLATMAMPRYFQHVDIAKETVLSENLRLTRDTIDKYYADTGSYPDSLGQLVDKKYLRALPFDPITDSRDSWILVPPADDPKGGVADIRSGAEGVARNGTNYGKL